jgi:hypothetical protein
MAATVSKITGLVGTSFSADIPPVVERVILSVEGPEKTGKTHFAFTAPGPIAYQAIDIGHEGVINKFEGKKKIYSAIYKFRPPVQAKADEDAMVEYAKKFWDLYERDYDAALKAGVRTVIWDTATEVWEMLRLSRFGKLVQVPSQKYVEVNGIFNEIVRRAYDHDANLILIHKQKAEYESIIVEGRSKSRPTGRRIRSGYNEMGYLAQALIKMEYNQEHKRFQAEVLEARRAPRMKGEIIEPEGKAQGVTFQQVCLSLFPDIDAEAWE